MKSNNLHPFWSLFMSNELVIITANFFAWVQPRKKKKKKKKSYCNPNKKNKYAQKLFSNAVYTLHTLHKQKHSPKHQLRQKAHSSVIERKNNNTVRYSVSLIIILGGKKELISSCIVPCQSLSRATLFLFNFPYGHTSTGTKKKYCYC